MHEPLRVSVQPPRRLPETFQSHPHVSGPTHNVVQLRKVKQKRAEGKRLCDSGFHKWVIKPAQFDVKSGKLVTPQRCGAVGRSASS